MVVKQILLTGGIMQIPDCPLEDYIKLKKALNEKNLVFMVFQNSTFVRTEDLPILKWILNTI
jgi:hypothetical protein